jgi:hypothetical protein
VRRGPELLTEKSELPTSNEGPRDHLKEKAEKLNRLNREEGED